VLTNSRDIKQRLEREGWRVTRVRGSHHVFKHPASRETIILPHPKKDLGLGLVRAIGKMGSGLRFAMPHYVAIVEEDGADKAVGIWFPDLSGCFSGGDDLDEALRNAPEAIGLYAESLAEEGRSLPSPRSLSELRHDPAVVDDIRNYMVALVAAPIHADAAE
jgi:predicted RNA binding protein YcfA (HicA-like mRNA interferase family)/predicted RNase H-like HicB family nuclease